MCEGDRQWECCLFYYDRVSCLYDAVSSLCGFFCIFLVLFFVELDILCMISDLGVITEFFRHRGPG